MRSMLPLTAVAAISLIVLSGCAPIVALGPAADAINPACAAVIVRLPATVASLGLRETDAQATGAWGTPATVLLHCGVAVPDPTSTLPCVTVDGIDWLRDATKDPNYAFITYGRDPAVQVVVDGRTVDGGTALGDLSPAVSIIPATRHCVSPDEVYDNGTPVPVPPSSAPSSSPPSNQPSDQPSDQPSSQPSDQPTK